VKETLRQRVVVGQGGRIPVPDLDLPAGTVAEAVILVENAAPGPHSTRDMLGSGPGCYESPEEAVRFLRRQREE